MEFETLDMEREGRVLIATLNRPQSLNAISATMLSEFKALAGALETDAETSVLLVRSEGPVFSVGYDLKREDWVSSQYPADHPDGVDIVRDRQDIHAILSVWMAVMRQPKPVVVEVQGPCLSGANELLAAADLVVASEMAEFGHPAARDLGLPPTVFFWPMLIGMRKTRELLYTGKLIGAGEALRLGLVNEVAAPDELRARGMALAQDVARTPAENLALLKHATSAWYENMGLSASCASGADFDAMLHQGESFKTFFRTLQAEGMKAALAERAKRFG